MRQMSPNDVAVCCVRGILDLNLNYAAIGFQQKWCTVGGRRGIPSLLRSHHARSSRSVHRARDSLRCVRFGFSFCASGCAWGYDGAFARKAAHESGQHNDPVSHVSSVSQWTSGDSKSRPSAIEYCYATVSLHILTAERIRVSQWTDDQTLIVDDEKPARDELAYLLKAFPEINLVGQGRNGVEAIALIKNIRRPGVLDVQCPGLNGLGVIRAGDRKAEGAAHHFLATAYDNYR